MRRTSWALPNYACHIATRPIEVRNQARLHRISANYDDNWNCRGRRFGGKCRRGCSRDDHGHLSVNEAPRCCHCR